MSFEVMASRCDQCLFGPNKIVSDARRKQLLRSLDANDDHFICHKATIAGRKVACRGDFEQRGGGKLGRLAKWLGVVVSVPEADLARNPRATGAAP